MQIFQETEVTTLPDLDLLKMAVDVGSFGMVAWLIFYTFSKMLPQTIDQFRQELQEERAVTQNGFTKLEEAVDRLSLIVVIHDSAVRGEDIDEKSAQNLLGLLGRYDKERKS